jgi:hypothetical protein
MKLLSLVLLASLFLCGITPRNKLSAAKKATRTHSLSKTKFGGAIRGVVINYALEPVSGSLVLQDNTGVIYEQDNFTVLPGQTWSGFGPNPVYGVDYTLTINYHVTPYIPSSQMSYKMIPPTGLQDASCQDIPGRGNFTYSSYYLPDGGTFTFNFYDLGQCQ